MQVRLLGGGGGGVFLNGRPPPRPVAPPPRGARPPPRPPLIHPAALDGALVASNKPAQPAGQLAEHPPVPARPLSTARAMLPRQFASSKLESPRWWGSSGTTVDWGEKREQSSGGSPGERGGSSGGSERRQSEGGSAGSLSQARNRGTSCTHAALTRPGLQEQERPRLHPAWTLWAAAAPAAGIEAGMQASKALWNAHGKRRAAHKDAARLPARLTQTP